MNAKEFLSQAYRFDQRINNKIEQVAALNELATKCTSVISDMPKNPSQSQSKMADTVDKIIDLQREINDDIDTLVDLKRDIVKAIKTVSNPEYQTILEQRYLCYCAWERIAFEMGYSLQHTFRLHTKAIREIDMAISENLL